MRPPPECTPDQQRVLIGPGHLGAESIGIRFGAVADPGFAGQSIGIEPEIRRDGCRPSRVDHLPADDAILIAKTDLSAEVEPQAAPLHARRDAREAECAGGQAVGIEMPLAPVFMLDLDARCEIQARDRHANRTEVTLPVAVFEAERIATVDPLALVLGCG